MVVRVCDLLDAEDSATETGAAAAADPAWEEQCEAEAPSVVGVDGVQVVYRCYRDSVVVDRCTRAVAEDVDHLGWAEAR